MDIRMKVTVVAKVTIELEHDEAQALRKLIQCVSSQDPVPIGVYCS